MKGISFDWSFLKTKKRLLLLGNDIFWTISSFFMAYFLRFNFSIPGEYLSALVKSLPLLVFFRFFSFFVFGLYNGLLRYASIDDLLRIIKAVTVGSLLFISSIAFLFHLMGFPRSVFLIDWFIILVFLGGSRFLYRIFREIYSFSSSRPKTLRRVLVIGAGDMGEMILRSIKREKDIPYEVVGLLDDDPDKIRRRIHGVEVLGGISNLGTVTKEREIKEVILAIQNISGTKIREITELCQSMGVVCKTVPSIGGILRGSISISHVRPVRVEDLLKRESVELDTKVIERFISNRIIMVTGAGGSIGSEICRQIMEFGPRQLILFERGENDLYDIELDLKERFPQEKVLTAVVGDIMDVNSIDRALSEYTPEVIFHAAAYKHVPIMEAHPLEAIKNNILGTWNVASKSCERGVQRFVLISTDKAVKPVSVMGATKRAAEMICQGLNTEKTTRFVAVRFGNVLESNGSVIPYFRRQIARGGPVTVTHAEVTRYFMTIPEAAQLVLQAGAMGKGGEIYLLDMGKPIKILDLAKDMISLSGLVLGDDIDIKFIGLRPGEKLHEELLAEKESLSRTPHPKIYEVNSSPISWDTFRDAIGNLPTTVGGRDRGAILMMLQEIVPDYQPDQNVIEEADVHF